MRPALVTLACLLALSTVAGAKDRPAERPAWKRAAKVAPARRSADLAKGAVDPYDPAG